MSSAAWLMPVAFVMLMQCSGSAAQPEETGTVVSVGQPFEVGVGMPVAVAETETRLTLTTVTEDSRCPQGVTCIWAGRVVIEVEAEAPGVGAESFSLATCCGPAEARHVFAGQVIELTGIEPGPPRAGQAIDPADYRATLVVTPI